MTGKILFLSVREPNLKLMIWLLKDEGYEVLVANSEEKCFQLLEENDVNMIVLDFNISEEASYKILEDIRKNERTKTVPVILITQLMDRIKETISTLGADHSPYS